MRQKCLVSHAFARSLRPLARPSAQLVVRTPSSLAPLAQATWEWVNDVETDVITQWGTIGDWDVSGVKDFSFALSAHRNQAGGSHVSNGNPKVGTMNAARFDVAKWNTAAATLMAGMFTGAFKMNSDFSGWDVSSVTNMEGIFHTAQNMIGTGLSGWNVAKVRKTVSVYV